MTKTEGREDIAQKLSLGNTFVPEADALRAESIDLCPGEPAQVSSFFKNGDRSRVAPTRSEFAQQWVKKALYELREASRKYE